MNKIIPIVICLCAFLFISPSFVTDSSVVYSNETYDFDLMLPSSWQGFSVVESAWSAVSADDRSITVSGAEIILRHPLWTEDEPRQDIPLQIITLDEWESIINDELLTSVPVPPLELQRNANYVIAIRARYNFWYLEGWEEVRQIVNENKFSNVFP